MKREEEKLHFAVCDYIRAQYPKVVFLSEGSGLRVSMGLATKMKRMRSNDTHLDIYILEPKGKYHALILEIKAVDIKQKKHPELFLKNEHVNDQRKTIEKLNKKGYLATFAVKFDEARSIVDNYMKS